MNDTSISDIQDRRLHLSLLAAGGRQLRCMELTWVDEGSPDTGSFSRWGDNAGNGPTVLTIAITQSGTPDDGATDALHAWVADQIVFTTGMITKSELREAMAFHPESLTQAPEAVVIDGVPVAGVVAPGRGAVARSCARAGTLVTVVHTDTLGHPISLITALPTLG